MQLNTVIMKTAVVAAVLILAFAGQSFAILRPRFPRPTAPPYGGQIFTIVDDRAPKGSAAQPR